MREGSGGEALAPHKENADFGSRPCPRSERLISSFHHAVTEAYRSSGGRSRTKKKLSNPSGKRGEIEPHPSEHSDPARGEESEEWLKREAVPKMCDDASSFECSTASKKALSQKMSKSKKSTAVCRDFLEPLQASSCDEKNPSCSGKRSIVSGEP